MGLCVEVRGVLSGRKCYCWVSVNIRCLYSVTGVLGRRFPILFRSKEICEKKSESQAAAKSNEYVSNT